MGLHQTISILGLLTVCTAVIAPSASADKGRPSPGSINECILRNIRLSLSRHHKEGRFTRAGAEHHESIGRSFKEGGTIKKITGEVRRVTEKDLLVNLSTQTREGLAKLTSLGRKNMSKFYYLTSGAGLWSRGGGQVKALIPFNLKALISSEEFAQLSKANDILNTTDANEILRLAGRQADPKRILAEQKELLDSIIKKARSHRDALNPIDLKIVNVALESEKAGTYIPFDIWTSEQTHDPIVQYLAEFRKGFSQKTFHPDPVIDRKIKKSIKTYLGHSEHMGDTHVLGYQSGVHAFDPETGEAILDTVPIGEGAGMAKAYLDESGRTAELLKRGKSIWVFENIEVVTDLSVNLGAHIKGQKEVSVILVPQLDNYKGGSPFMVTKNGKTNMELHEMSALPKEFATGNAYFNSNTIFQPLKLPPPRNLGFEGKTDKGRKIVRVKVNAGDITHEAETGGILGRIGIEYENFKNYMEFGQNGEKLIDTFRDIWAGTLP